MGILKLALVQTDIAWGDPLANMTRLDPVIGANAGADLVVLPEMWSTGFTMEPERHAEQEPGAALQWMKDKAAQTGAAIAGSIAVRDTDGRYRNRLYFVKPDGEVEHYDKHHLFTYSGEDRHYSAGQDRCVVHWKGAGILLTVCYDLRFPGWCRNHGDYDLMLCVASWPDRRVKAWEALLKARAIENQCWVAGVNRVGDDGACHYSGSSALVDPYGDMICAADGRETVIRGEMDTDALEGFRKSFPVLEDRD